MRQEIRNYLHYLMDLGEEEVFLDQPPMDEGADALMGDRLQTMESLRREAEGCRRCPLGGTRTNSVFGIGNPHAELMFIGEAPGREEDLKGEPFVGAAGQLLDRILKAMGLRRDEVYIANLLKCRPPGNRDPQHEEIEACWHFLERQVETVHPRVICTLGSYSASALLGIHAPLSRLRGRVHAFRGIDVVPTYHPAALLRNPAWKRPTWEDMQRILSLLERSIPG